MQVRLPVDRFAVLRCVEALAEVHSSSTNLVNQQYVPAAPVPREQSAAGLSDLLSIVANMPHLLTIRGEEPPGDTSVIVRAGVMSLETLRRTAADSFEDFGAFLISVEAVLDGLTVMETCVRSPRIGQRYGKVRLSTVGRLRAAGLVLLATFSRHFDVVLPDLSEESLQRLIGCFDDPIDNPGRGPGGVSS